MSPRSLKIICAVSILLNVFMLGAVIGGVAWVGTRHPMIGVGSIRIAGSELPRDERRTFRRVLRDARREMRPTVMAGRQARADTAALLRAPTLDQAALTDALSRVRTTDFAIRAHVEARAVGFVASLPPTERAKLADGIERRWARVGAMATETQQ